MIKHARSDKTRALLRGKNPGILLVFSAFTKPEPDSVTKMHNKRQGSHV